MKLIKTITALVLTCACLTACTNTKTESVETTEATPELELADVSSLNSDTAGFFMDFLKLGGLESDEISAEHPDWVASVDGTKESWDYEAGSEDMISYSRDSADQVSYYNRTFSIKTSNIQRWINVELTAIDTLLNAVHQREGETAYTWSYKWTGEGETAVLKIYSTGETGNYVGLVSFVRQGITTIDQIANEGVAGDEAVSVQ